MRITDIVTPQELKQIFDREFQEIGSFGKRNDLVKRHFWELSKRIDIEYVTIIAHALGSDEGAFFAASQCGRILCLIDRFLEEKYASNKPTN